MCPCLCAQQGALATDIGTQPQQPPAPADPHRRAARHLRPAREGIRLVNDAPNAAQDTYHLDEQRLLAHLTQKAGQPADAAKLRTDLRYLFASGKFDQISLDSDTAGGNEVVLSYHTLPRYFVGVIYMSGAPRPPSANQLIDTTKLQLGEAFTQAKLSEADRPHPAQPARERLVSGEDRGQSPAQRQHPAGADHLRHQQGASRRASATSLFTGDLQYTQGQLRDRAKFHPGDRATAARLTRAVSRLRKKLQKKDRLEAQIAVAQRNYVAASNTIDYVFDIQPGPKIDVRLEGAKLRKSKLKKYIPIYEENTVDDDLLNEGRRNLRDYFQGQGYFDVTVDFTRKQESAQRTAVVFDVDKGVRHKVVKVEITGNKYFSTEDLRQRMSIQPADLLLRQGRFSQKDLSNDVSAIRDLYQANGFSQVKITPNIDDNYGNKKGDIAVILAIDGRPAGPRRRPRHRRRPAHFSEDRIRDLLTETPRTALFPIQHRHRSRLHHQLLLQPGLPARPLRIEGRTPKKADPNRVDLAITINEGERVYVDRTLIYGLKHTKPSMVERSGRVSKDGAPLDQSELLDTQRKLYDLTIFNEVDEAVQNPNGAAQYKNVILHMDEARRYTFNYGLGFEAQTGQVNNSACQKVNGRIVNANCNPNGSVGFSPRVSFDVSRINFRGTDQSITLKTNYGRLQKRALLTYQDPRVFNHPTLTFTANAFYDNTQDVLTFSAKRAEGSLQLKQQLTKATTLIYRYTYRRVSVNAATLNVSPDQVPLLSLPVRLGMPSFTYIRDTRDDPLDSTKGSYNSADFGISATSLGSDCSSSLIPGQNVATGNPLPRPQLLPHLRPELHLLHLRRRRRQPPLGLRPRDRASARRAPSVSKAVSFLSPSASTPEAATPIAASPSIRPAPATRLPAFPSAATASSSTTLSFAPRPSSCPSSATTSAPSSSTTWAAFTTPPDTSFPASSASTSPTRPTCRTNPADPLQFQLQLQRHRRRHPLSHPHRPRPLRPRIQPQPRSLPPYRHRSQ